MRKISITNEKEIKEFAIKLEALYEFYDWTWGDSESCPTREEIEEHIYYLIQELNELKKDKISSGGITVEKDEHGYDIYFSRELHLWI